MTISFFEMVSDSDRVNTSRALPYRQEMILKPPKLRQPLQCVGSHVSSSESSPTVRIERRVSFAKNRRIREFCNEAEQGTVWDDTYEEHDSNSTKSNSSIGNDQQVIISVPCQDKENFPIQLFIPTEKIGSTEVTGGDLMDENQIILHDSQVEDCIDNFQVDPRLRDEDNLTYPNATIYCNDGMDETNLVPSEIIPRCNDYDPNQKHGVCQSPSVIDKGVSADETENLPSVPLVSNGEKTQYFHDESMHVTETIPVQQNIFLIINQCPRSDHQEKMSIHLDAQLEKASIPVMSNTAPLDNVGLPACAQDKTRIFSCNSMNVTETIPIQGFHRIDQEKNFSTINLLSAPIDENPNNARQSKTVCDGVTQIFQNASMDLTSRVVTLPPVTKTVKSSIENIEMSICEDNLKSNFCLDKETITQNKPATSSTTHIYPDDSMELTSVVPIVQSNLKNQSTILHLHEEKTNEEMNITCKDRNHIPNYHDESVYLDKSMSMTVAAFGKEIPQDNSQLEKRSSVYGINPINLSGLPILNSRSKEPSQSESNSISRTDNDTEDDQDDDMRVSYVRNSVKPALTDRHMHGTSQIKDSRALETLSNRCLDDRNPLGKNHLKSESPPTPTSQGPRDDSIKLTLSVSKPLAEIARITDHMSLDRMSKIIDNAADTMPITQSIPATNENSIYTSKSMCMTVPVSSHKSFENMSHMKSLNDGKTQIFQNMSMDITSKISTMPTLTKPMTSHLADSKLHHSNNDLDHTIPGFIPRKSQVPSVTQIYQNESMELTSACAILHPRNRDLTNQLDLDTMQRQVNTATEFIPLVQYSLSNDAEKRRSRDGFENEMLAPNNKSSLGDRPNNHNSGVTQIFQNMSMDLTSKLSTQPTITKPTSLRSAEAKQSSMEDYPNASYGLDNRKPESPLIHHEQLTRDESMNLPSSLSTSQIKFREASAQSNLNIKDCIEHDELKMMNNEEHFNVNNQNMSNEISMKIAELTSALANRRDEARSRYQKDGATQIFHDEPMDFTSRISTFPTLVKPISTFMEYEKSDEAENNFISNVNANNGITRSGTPPSGVTQIDQDYSMELTSSLPSSQNDGADEVIGHSRVVPRESRSLQKESRVSQGLMNNSFRSVDNMLNRFASSHHQSLYDSNRVLAIDSPDSNVGASVTPRISKTSGKFNESNNLSNLSHFNPLQNSLNVSCHLSRRSNHESFSRFGIEDKSFHRITSDELNTLCASMNLPNQRYDRTENTTMLHSIIPSCNDIQVLRDSLEKNRILLQNSIYGSHTCTTSNEISRSLEKTSKINDKDDDFVHLHSSNLRNESITAPKNLSLVVNSSRLCESYTESSIPNHQPKVLHTQNMETDQSPDARSFEQARNIRDSNGLSCDGESSSQQNRQHLLRFRDEGKQSLEDSLHVIETSNATENLEMDRRKISDICFSTHRSSNKLIANAVSSVIKDNSVHETVKIFGSIIDKQYAQLENGEENNEMSASKSISCKRPSDSEVQVYHDSMNAEDTSPASATKRRKSCEVEIRNSSPPSVDVQANFNKENVPLSRENSLTRIPSDNTDTLIATMGFKTELSYPLIINEKTIIKISSKCTLNRTGMANSDASCENQIEVSRTRSINVNPNFESVGQPSPFDEKEITIGDVSVNNVEGLPSSFGKSAIEDIPRQCEVDQKNAHGNGAADEALAIDQLPDETEMIVELEALQDVEIDGKKHDDPNECNAQDDDPSLTRMNSILGQSREELEEIQPPSFLCSDNTFEDLHEQVEAIHQDVDTSVKDVIPKISSPLANVNKADELPEIVKIPIEKSLELSSESQSFRDVGKDCKVSTEPDRAEEATEDTFELGKVEEEEPLTPFLALLENIKARELRDDCIWFIHEMNAKMIAIDFITKSFVVIVRLNEFEKECAKDIDRIEFRSRLRDDCKNVLMRIVHDLLLTKLTTCEFDQYKLYEDILPLLEFVSNEVISVMSFMFDLERLNALNLMDIKRDRINMTISSKKANIILKISLAIKVFNEIGPDDINVTRILGNIKESDIKRLVVNVKKDHRFLSRYIKDIKDYATLIEEMTPSNKQ